jgi:hypothetical protein
LPKNDFYPYNYRIPSIPSINTEGLIIEKSYGSKIPGSSMTSIITSIVVLSPYKYPKNPCIPDTYYINARKCFENVKQPNIIINRLDSIQQTDFFKHLVSSSSLCGGSNIFVITKSSCIKDIILNTDYTEKYVDTIYNL